jgi:ubiquinone/menaquinone biosynthesis C-methylase UbiE
VIDENINNKASPKYHVKRFFEKRKIDLKNKIVIDIPAGNGVTAEMLLNFGAQVKAFDLFPEYFMLDGVSCNFADAMKEIPLESRHADWLVCQEGIEHFSDQLKALKEFNRVLKKDGHLIVTTPSYSSLSAKLSYLLFESETNRSMPPNEINDIWMSSKNNNEIYYGHIFLIGLQKLRTLAKLSGFKIEEIQYVRISKGSLLLLPFLYPLILINSCFVYLRNIKKNSEISMETKKKVYLEQLKINIGIKNLINRHTLIHFKKESELSDLDFRNESIVKPFNEIM